MFGNGRTNGAWAEFLFRIRTGADSKSKALKTKYMKIKNVPERTKAAAADYAKLSASEKESLKVANAKKLAEWNKNAKKSGKK